MCILISFNGIYHFIVKCKNHSFLTWWSPRIPYHWWLTWKILECELDLLKVRNIFFYFPFPFSKYNSIWSCFLFCFVLFLFCQYFYLTTLSNRPFHNVFWGGKGRKEKAWEKSSFDCSTSTCSAGPVSCFFSHIHLNDIFEAERAVTG